MSAFRNFFHRALPSDLVDFADDFYCLPPLDILCAAQADRNIQRLADQLAVDCHRLKVIGTSAAALAVVIACPPDVLMIDACSDEGVRLAREVREQFGNDIVLIGMASGRVSATTAWLFDHVLPKADLFNSLPYVLGLRPEEPGDACALQAQAVAFTTLMDAAFTVH